MSIKSEWSIFPQLISSCPFNNLLTMFHREYGVKFDDTQYVEIRNI